jgi:ADP-heptose:LPS heptosyltransferase
VKSETRILVYQIGSLGDTVVSIPALKAIRRHYGLQAHIVLLHEVRSDSVSTPAEVLDGLGLVDEFLEYKFFSHPIRQYLNAGILAARLRARRFQSVVYLMPSERPAASVKRDVFFFRASGIHQQIGFHAFSPQILYPVDAEGLPAPVPHEAWFRLERLRRDGIDVSVELDLTKPFLSLPARFVNQARQWLSERRTASQLPLVAICPGCKQPANVWPIERFVELGQRLMRQGGVEIVVVGGPAERETAQRMIEAWGNGLNAAGEFPPLGSAALLAECAFMVGLDTGTTHLAASQGIPCVALYGCREEPGRFYPLGKGHIVLRHSVSCAGCRLVMKPCSIAGHPCMMGITVDEVWKAIQKMQAARL